MGFLVGGWTNPLEKYYIVKLDHVPRDPGENEKCLSCHHLDLVCKMCVEIHQKEPTNFGRKFTLI